MESSESHLRYIDARSVETPVGKLNEMTLISPTSDEVGKLDGMIFDPWARHVCFFVVESNRWFNTQRYLLPATPSRIEPDGKTLHVDVEPNELHALPQVNRALYPRMSDDDLISALFSPPAA